MKWRTRIEQLMLEREWNQYDLADHCGYRQSNIVRILKLESPPSLKVQQRLAKAFDIPLEQLMPGSLPTYLGVPVLSKEQLKLWLNNELPIKDIVDWSPSPVSRSGLFAYRLSSNDSQPGCPYGSTVIIDPAMSLALNHKILCQLDNRTMVRQFVKVSDTYYLNALLPNLPAFEIDPECQSFQYIGSVICTLVEEVSP